MTDGPRRAEATELSLPKDTPMSFGPDTPVMHALASMRAMRRLRPDPVPDELIETLIRAATWGPSASNAQQYGFVAVTDRAKMAELAVLWRESQSAYQALQGRLVPDFDDPASRRMMDALAYQADHFEDTPVVIAACHQRMGAEKIMANPRKVQAIAKDLGWANMRRLAGSGMASMNLGEASSIYPAVQNLLIAARVHGLAANLTIWHLFREADFRRVLGVPKTHGIFGLIPIGWPAGNFGPVRRRPVAEVLHWNQWSGD